jgi:hypothetical protein
MSSPASRAKYVAGLTVAVVAAGAFAGVSHDGRGTGAAVDPDPAVTSSAPGASVTQTAGPEPTVPALSPRLRLRSHGS